MVSENRVEEVAIIDGETGIIPTYVGGLLRSGLMLTPIEVMESSARLSPDGCIMEGGKVALLNTCGLANAYPSARLCACLWAPGEPLVVTLPGVQQVPGVSGCGGRSSIDRYRGYTRPFGSQRGWRSVSMSLERSDSHRSFAVRSREGKP